MKDNEKDLMVNSVVAEYILECSRCENTIGDYDTSEYDLVDKAAMLGWRATRDNVYCPDCAHKKLKTR